MPTSQDLAQAITATLVRLAISQREAAKRTGISPRALSNMCLGQVPRPGKLLQFATGLGVDPAPLLEAAGYTPVEQLPSAPIVSADYQAITDFCVRVAGDSMYPHLQDGDIVGVKAQSCAESGQVVVARLEGTITITRLFQVSGGWELTPFNPGYPPTRIAANHPRFTIIGLVAWHVHRWLAL